MGYTHDWTVRRTISASAWEAIGADFRRLLGELPAYAESAGGYFAEAPRVLGNGLGEPGDPVIRADSIIFNGVGDLSHETLAFCRPRSRDFCKTARKPYDVVVSGLRIVAYHPARDRLSVHSDGDTAEWQPALEWIKATLGKDYVLPPSIRFTAPVLEDYGLRLALGLATPDNNAFLPSQAQEAALAALEDVEEISAQGASGYAVVIHLDSIADFNRRRLTDLKRRLVKALKTAAYTA